MSSVAISEINTDANTLDDKDLILVSKSSKDGTAFTSAKITGEKLKASISSSAACGFSSDIVKEACSNAITSTLNNNTNIIVNSTGFFLDPTKTQTVTTLNNWETVTFTLNYDSYVKIWISGKDTTSELTQFMIYISVNGNTLCKLARNPDTLVMIHDGCYLKKGTEVTITRTQMGVTGENTQEKTQYCFFSILPLQ